MLLCLDCIGIIISYLEFHKTLFNLLLLSKRVRYYIENEGRFNCFHIHFEVRVMPCNPIPYAFRIGGNITDDIVWVFKNLRVLYVCYEGISDVGLVNIKNLQELYLAVTGDITNDGISKLKNLKLLDLTQNQDKIITDDGIKGLKNLHTLNIEGYDMITDEGIKDLKNLRKLITRSWNISDKLIDKIYDLEPYYKYEINRNNIY